jgi:hypothetical protein
MTKRAASKSESDLERGIESPLKLGSGPKMPGLPRRVKPRHRTGNLSTADYAFANMAAALFPKAADGLRAALPTYGRSEPGKPPKAVWARRVPASCPEA